MCSSDLLEQDSPSTPIHFQKPKLEEHSFESVSYTFTQVQPNIVVGSSAIFHQPTTILVFSPPSFTFTTSSSTLTTQGAVNQVVNMATPTFLMDRYAPLNISQPMNAMPQEYLKLFPYFTGEDEGTVEQHLPLFCTFAENLNVEHLDVMMRLFVKSLSGEARKWFKGLPNDSMNDWEEL